MTPPEPQPAAGAPQRGRRCTCRRWRLWGAGILAAGLLVAGMLWVLARVAWMERSDWGGRRWAHRVNTPADLAAARGRFAGIELDLVYQADTHSWEVYHPPEPRSGLTLENLLAGAGTATGKGQWQPALWLDLRNLGGVDPAAAAAALARQLAAARGGLAGGEIWVESPELERLVAFRQAGFRIVHYLPPGLVGENGIEPAQRAELERRWELLRPDAISAPLADYDRLAAAWPEATKLLWAGPEGRWWSELRRAGLAERARRDASVVVLLVPLRP